jgi:hypothetical protein
MSLRGIGNLNLTFKIESFEILAHSTECYFRGLLKFWEWTIKKTNVSPRISEKRTFPMRISEYIGIESKIQSQIDNFLFFDRSDKHVESTLSIFDGKKYVFSRHSMGNVRRLDRHISKAQNLWWQLILGWGRVLLLNSVPPTHKHLGPGMELDSDSNNTMEMGSAEAEWLIRNARELNGESTRPDFLRNYGLCPDV